MEKRTFGKTGFEVSVLGFGAAPAAFLKAEEEEAAGMIRALLDRGMNVIDTAASYPGSHAFLGRHVTDRRDDFVLVSKCGTKLNGIDEPAWSAGNVAKTINRALADLNTDVIDVMLLHSCDLATLKQGDAMGALVAARDAGKVKFVGYSGDNEAAAYAAALPDVAVIETSVNLADQRNIDLVLPACAKHNVGVIAKRPVANAAWKQIDEQPGMYKNYAADYTKRLAAMKLRPSELGFASDDNDAWSELALRFTLSQPAVTTAIIGTTNPKHAETNFAAAAKGALPREVIEKVRNAFRAADPGGSWMGLT